MKKNVIIVIATLKFLPEMYRTLEKIISLVFVVLIYKGALVNIVFLWFSYFDECDLKEMYMFNHMVFYLFL